jgi:hypothetical protein
MSGARRTWEIAMIALLRRRLTTPRCDARLMEWFCAAGAVAVLVCSDRAVVSLGLTGGEALVAFGFVLVLAFQMAILAVLGNVLAARGAVR